MTYNISDSIQLIGRIVDFLGVIILIVGILLSTVHFLLNGLGQPLYKFLINHTDKI